MIRKILIIRFSSIGDIVLTTPVVRALKQQVKGIEIHYLTKAQFTPILQENPYIDRIIGLENNLGDTIQVLKKEDYDHIIDLHHNLRTTIIKRKLGRPSSSFNKLNIQKWLLVNWKIDRMPPVHIVDRYLDAAAFLGINNDQQGLDFFIPEKEEIHPSDYLAAFSQPYMAVAVGANHFTKQIPGDKIVNIVNQVGVPVILLGGNDVDKQAEEMVPLLKVPTYNAVGKINLYQSASFIRQSHVVLTPDTGMMHIAAAYKKNTVSLWGNTVPELGMYPYLAGDQSKIFEITSLKCRPCSKIGYDKCPKKHFNCMRQINDNDVSQYILGLFQ
jgi:ADP-heptose:LPS heptosyltransferase